MSEQPKSGPETQAAPVPSVAPAAKNVSRLRGMLGLARRAGKVAFGFEAVAEAAAKGRARAVLLAYDASERTKKAAAEVISRAGGGAPVFAVLPIGKEETGRAIGRGETAVLAVTDAGFADQILELVGENPRKEGDLS